jgi:deoxyribonuclease-4
MLIGGHMSSAGGIYTAIDRIEAIGGDCVQVFTQSPRMWRPTAHKPEAIEQFRERRAEARIGGVICHALYLINLASVEFRAKSVEALRTTLDVAGRIEASAVVFHVGSHLGAGFESALDNVVSAIGEVLDGYDGEPWLAMENSAGPGGTIGRSIGELATLMDALDRHPKLGICLDSCHLFASGYDVRDPAAVADLVAEIDETIGLDRLTALHANDSATPLGSNRDRHANILEGEIGEGLGAFLAHPAFEELGAYMEVPGTGDGVNVDEIRKLRELHARWM